MGVIFVVGVHGVGKTSCCQQLAESTGIPHYSASNLIKAEDASAFSESAKECRDVRGNQSLLIRGVRKILRDRETILLDGHCTLLNSDGAFEAVGVEVFSQLGLAGIVLFRDAPETICARLHQRDGKAWKLSAVTAQQDAELAHAQFVASELCIPFACLDAFDIHGFGKVIAALKLEEQEEPNAD